jgi:hypothetical protein
MLEICIQTSYDQNVQLILKSYLPVVYGTPLIQSEPSLSYMYIIARTSYIQGDDDDVRFVQYDVCMQISSISVIKTTERKAAIWLVNL